MNLDSTKIRVILDPQHFYNNFIIKVLWQAVVDRSCSTCTAGGSNVQMKPLDLKRKEKKKGKLQLTHLWFD